MRPIGYQYVRWVGYDGFKKGEILASSLVSLDTESPGRNTIQRYKGNYFLVLYNHFSKGTYHPCSYCCYRMHDDSLVGFDLELLVHELEYYKEAKYGSLLYDSRVGEP